MRVVLTALLLLVLPLSFAHANSLTVGVMDSDPKGANVRETPVRGGKIINVVQYPGSQEGLYERRVTVSEQKGEWFNVLLEDASTGWMHKSILGMCASAAGDTPCELRAEPDSAARGVAQIPAGETLGLEGFTEGWVKLRYAGAADGKTVVGWLPEECLSASGTCISGKNALTFRNETEYLTLISFDIITQTGRTTITPLIDPERSFTILRPANNMANGTVDLDCYMGMPNNIHFLFTDVPFNKIDTLLVYWEDENTPGLELFMRGESLGSLSGTMTQDDMRGDEEDEDDEDEDETEEPKN